MNNVILVLFQCKKWFVYQTIWFKALLLRLLFLKIDIIFTMIPQVDLFSFVFWEKLKTPKRHFEINRPLGPARAMKQLSYYVFWVCVVHLIHCIGKRLIGTYLPYVETVQNLSTELSSSFWKTHTRIEEAIKKFWSFEATL